MVLPQDPRTALIPTVRRAAPRRYGPVQTVVTIGIATLSRGHHVDTREVVGMALIFLGLFLVSRQARRSTRPPPHLICARAHTRMRTSTSTTRASRVSPLRYSPCIGAHAHAGTRLRVCVRAWTHTGPQCVAAQGASTVAAQGASTSTALLRD